jgi:hypothetical protein
MYLLCLEIDDRADLGKKFAGAAFQVCELARWIAERTEDGESMVLAASVAVGLSKRGGDEYVEWAKATVAKIKNPSVRQEGIALVERQMRRVKGEKLPGDLWVEATPEQVYTNMAIGIGIKMSDPNDPLTKLVRIGISDADPSRIFTTCKNIFISLGSMQTRERYLLQRLGLPAGPKVIHCEKHRYALMGNTLDEAYAIFRDQYCKNCPDREPRPDEWRYSHDWHEEEGQRLAALVREFRSDQK